MSGSVSVIGLLLLLFVQLAFGVVTHFGPARTTKGLTSGPLPSGTTGTYVYDARNRLTGAGGSTYRYNPDGLRVATTGTGAATYLVDPNGLSRVLAQTVGGTTTRYVWGLGLLYEATGSTTRYYHADQVGSTVALTDSAGVVTGRVDYAPFGEVVARSGNVATPYLYNGEAGVETEASGLLYMRARYYQPRLMRFLNADPIRFEGGMNWYAFAGNNPLGYFDPAGTERIAASMQDSKSASAGRILDYGYAAFGLMATDAMYAIPHTMAFFTGNWGKSAPGYESYRELVFETAEIDPDSWGGTTLDVSTAIASIYLARRVGGRAQAVERTTAAETAVMGCFVAGTLVATANGEVAIEHIAPGDAVWSYDFNAKKWELQKVLDAYQRNYSGEMATLLVSGESIEATGNHPIWVIDGIDLEFRPSVRSDIASDERSMTEFGRWVEARDLQTGDELYLSSGERIRLAGLSIRNDAVEVYDFHVAENHNYSVSAVGVLAHNNSAMTWSAHGYKHFPAKNVSWDKIISSTRTGPAKYKPGVDIRKLEMDAFRNGTPVKNGKP